MACTNPCHPQGCQCCNPSHVEGNEVFYTGPNLPNVGIITNDDFNTVTQKLAAAIGSGGGSNYTNEMAQDAVGTILTNTASITFTYDDATPSIKANIVDSYVLSLINSNISGNYIQNQTAVVQSASSRISGSQTANSFIAQGGPIILSPNTADYGAVDGSLLYRTDLGKGRIRTAGTYKNIATEETIGLTGKIIHVDKLSVNATDTRAGLSVYSSDRPFKTIQAAVTAAPTFKGHCVLVRPGDYTENISAPGGLHLRLMAGTVIVGTITSNDAMTILGDSNLYVSGDSVIPIAYITSNTGTPTINACINPTAGSPINQIEGAYILNTGSGQGITVPFGTMIMRQTTVLSKGEGLYSTTYAPVYIEECNIKSTENKAIHCENAKLTCINSTLITTSTNGAHSTLSTGNGTNFWIENCRIYSTASYGMYGNNWGGTHVYRNNMSNTFLQAFTFSTLGVGGDGTLEVINNIMNVRDTATLDAFSVSSTAGIASPSIPVIIGNKYNKGQFTVQFEGLTPLVYDNVDNLPFPASYPRIGNLSAVAALHTDFQPNSPI